MKKIIVLFISIACIFSLTACTTNDNDAASSDESSMSEAPSSSPAAPSSQASSRQPSSSEPTSSQSEAPKRESSTPAQHNPPVTNNNPPTADTAPILDGANFYTNIEGGAASIMVTGLGRFSLDYDQATNLFGNMSLGGLEPTEKDYKLDMNGQGEAIVFTHPNFSHELRLDRAMGVAMYQTGGKTYYYTFSDAEYESILGFVMRAYNEVEASLPEATKDADGNINVVTG